VSSVSLEVSTGHAILSYMEDHLNNKNRLEKEWEELCNYEADLDETFVGLEKTNMSKNRYSDILPCKFVNKSDLIKFYKWSILQYLYSDYQSNGIQLVILD
jgi:hypothetical protein